MSSSGERTEEATPRRRSAALAAGMSAHSALAESAVAIAVAVVPACLLVHYLAGWPNSFRAAAGTAASLAHVEYPGLLSILRDGIVDRDSWALWLTAWLTTVAAAALVAGACGSLKFAPASIAVTVTRLRQRGGVARIASGETLMQAAVAVVATAAVMVSCIPILARATASLSKGLDPLAQAGGAVQSCAMLWSATVTVLAIGGAIDVIVQRRRHATRLKMTPRELRDERAQAEGRPEAKQRRRALGLRQARNVRIAAIRRATAVVTNPTHLAVALRYAPPAIDVPVIVARGADLMAPVVRAAAHTFGVPVVESPELAQMLYSLADIDEAIPEECYAAVAAVFTWIIRTRGALRRGDDDEA
jgi:flagellar biosynthesis protein FlhB